MQCRVNGVVINNTPKICICNPDDLSHSIGAENLMNPDVKLHIPLLLRGITSCFNVCCLNIDEYEN